MFSRTKLPSRKGTTKVHSVATGGVTRISGPLPSERVRTAGRPVVLPRDLPTRDQHRDQYPFLQQTLSTATQQLKSKQPQNAPRLQTVKFVCRKKTHFGQTVHLVGASEELGAWSVASCLDLVWGEGHEWHCHARLPPGQHEFKFVLRDSNGGGAHWEACRNRELQICSDTGSSQYSTSWNSSAAELTSAPLPKPATTQRTAARSGPTPPHAATSPQTPATPSTSSPAPAAPARKLDIFAVYGAVSRMWKVDLGGQGDQSLPPPPSLVHLGTINDLSKATSPPTSPKATTPALHSSVVPFAVTRDAPQAPTASPSAAQRGLASVSRRVEAAKDNLRKLLDRPKAPTPAPEPAAAAPTLLPARPSTAAAKPSAVRAADTKLAVRRGPTSLGRRAQLLGRQEREELYRLVAWSSDDGCEPFGAKDVVVKAPVQAQLAQFFTCMLCGAGGASGGPEEAAAAAGSERGMFPTWEAKQDGNPGWVGVAGGWDERPESVARREQQRRDAAAERDGGGSSVEEKEIGRRVAAPLFVGTQDVVARSGRGADGAAAGKRSSQLVA